MIISNRVKSNMPGTSSFSPFTARLSYANAVKRLTQAHVSRTEKINICRWLLSSQYHPNPSTVVLNFLCSLISKEAPTPEECYSILDLPGDTEDAVQEWNLLTKALLNYKDHLKGHLDHRGAPQIPDAVLVQGGLHLLRGPVLLQKAAISSLHHIIRYAQYSRDLGIHTWLFCAVAKAKSSSVLLLPLEKKVLSTFVSLLSQEQQPDTAASAAAAVASYAVPSRLASRVEWIVVRSVRASPYTFQEKFGAWVRKSEPSLPNTVQFLLRTYLKYPKRSEELLSTKKRAISELTSHDALELFESTSEHILHAIKDDGDQRDWEEVTFHSRMKAIQMLYQIGAENHIYIPSSNELRCEGSESKKRRGSGRQEECSSSKVFQELMLELIGISSSILLERDIRQERIRLTFHAITALVHYFPEAAKDQMSSLLAGCFIARGKSEITNNLLREKSELFRFLVSEYERLRALDGFLGHLMKLDDFETMVPILRQRLVQDALAKAFSQMRELEVKGCVESLRHRIAPLSAAVTTGLTLIYSILLETTSPSYAYTVATTCSTQIASLFATQNANAEIRQCRMHILSSFLVANKANDFLATTRDLRRFALELACSGMTSKKYNLDGDVSFVRTLLEALPPGEELSSTTELCSNLRCLTGLVYYAIQYHDMDSEGLLIAKALQKIFASFGCMQRMRMKSKSSKMGASSPNLLYGNASYCLVLNWLGSLGSLVKKYTPLEIAGKEATTAMFLSQAVRYFPEKHLLWSELNEEPDWGLAVSKAAYDSLEELSDIKPCETDFCDCSASRVLEYMSVMPTKVYDGLDIGRLLNMILHYMALPCCPDSRLSALKTLLNMGKSLGIGQLLTTLHQTKISLKDQKLKHHSRTGIRLRQSIPRHDLFTATMQILASQTLEQQAILCESSMIALLKEMIRDLMMTSESALHPLADSSEKWYEVMGALFDFRASLEALQEAGIANDQVYRLAQDVRNCTKIVLRHGLKVLRKDFLKRIPLLGEAEDMLLAMLKSASPIHRHILTKDECTLLNETLTRTFLMYLLHSNHEKKYLASSIFLELPLFQGKSKQWISRVWMTLLRIVTKEVIYDLTANLEGDEVCECESTWKLVSLATSLTLASGRMYSVCPSQSQDSDAIAVKGPLMVDYSSEHVSWTFGVGTTILQSLEEFIRQWTSTSQEPSDRRMAKLQGSDLLRHSEAFIVASLNAFLELFEACRSWSRRNVEKVVLLSTQVVERICSCEKFLRCEKDVLMNALRICRLAVKRHPGQISSVSRVLYILLRRGIKTENKIIITAVREAVEELCTMSKTWEILSALLADCCTALEESMGADLRREAEKVVAVLFKTVGELKAQHILRYLKDNGKEPLQHAWELFSQKLHYFGK